MDPSLDDRHEIGPELWRLWAHKGKLREKAAIMRMQKTAARIAVGVALFGIAVYWIFVR